ncbi:hypothetical protein RKD49_001863 [Streptomyces glaucescens]
MSRAVHRSAAAPATLAVPLYHPVSHSEEKP